MARSDELRLMTKIARLYHEQGVRQKDIALQLHLSQATVSRLLKRAQEEDIVRVTVRIPEGLHPDLEDALQNMYDLKDVIVADCDSTDEVQVQRSIGAAGAAYIENTLAANEVIGISSWSETLLCMVDAMRPVNRISGVQVVQILGGMGDPAVRSHALRLIARLSTLVRGTSTLLPAPGIVGSAESRQVLSQDPFLRETLELFGQVTLALVGIGAVEPSELLASSGNAFSEQELELLRARGAVGDLLLHFFDTEGNPVSIDFDERVVAMTLDQIRRVKRVVAFAGGVRKLAAIRGALRGGWVNILVTDQYTAELLLAE